MTQMNAHMQMNNHKGQMNDHKGQRHLAGLGPVRMLVIALIAFGYASTMPRGPQSAEYLNIFGYDPSWYGIQMIFMISGFLALRSLRRHGSGLKLLASRLARNAPTVIVFALLVIAVLFPLFSAPLAAGETRLSQHLLYFIKVVLCIEPNIITPGLLDNALYMCVIQGGLWTFRWGLIAFIATAILWAVGGLRNARLLAILTLGATLVYAALVVYVGANPQTSDNGMLQAAVVGLRLGWAYLAGMYLFAYRRRLRRSFFIPAGLLAIAAMQFYFLRWTPFIEITATLGFGYVVFLAMTSRTPVPAFMGRMPDLSLGLYVYNWPAAQITLLLIPSLTPYPLFAISFPVTIILSYLTWVLVSRKINMGVRNRLEIKPA